MAADEPEVQTEEPITAALQIDNIRLELDMASLPRLITPKNRA